MNLRPPLLLALLAILPFTVGFVPPEEEGGHASFSVGKGRYLTQRVGCTQARMVEYTDQQLGYYHRWNLKDAAETRLGVGADLSLFQGRERDCANPACDSGSTEYLSMGTLGPHATLDWRWAGLGFGLQLPAVGPYGSQHQDVPILWFPLSGKGSLRLGRTDLIYASLEFRNGQPVTSGYPFPFGLGGRLLGFDLWAGVERFAPDAGVSGVLARKAGPLRLRLAGNYMPNTVRFDGEDGPGNSVLVTLPQQAVSIGLDYHLPW